VRRNDKLCANNKMAPITRSRARKTTPDRPTRAGECSTKDRHFFFRDYDRDHTSKSMDAICAPYGITRKTGYIWVQQRKELGTPAYNYTRKLSKILGRRSRVSKEQINMLLSPSRNPVRTQAFEAQIAFHDIKVNRRQLRTRITQEDPGAGVYKMAYTKSDFSKDNIVNRLKYGQKYVGASVEDTYQFWVFTDEAHFDPTAQKAGRVLRRRGRRLASENIQKRGKKKGIILHAADCCNWWDMAPSLIWYHEAEEHIEQLKPKRPTKPRKTQYESVEDYKKRIAKWEVEFPQPVKVKPLGNSMTGKTYSEQILPHYITAIHNLRRRFDMRGEEHHFVLQEVMIVLTVILGTVTRFKTILKERQISRRSRIHQYRRM